MTSASEVDRLLTISESRLHTRPSSRGPHSSTFQLNVSTFCLLHVSTSHLVVSKVACLSHKNCSG